jgi:VanZ family protein
MAGIFIGSTDVLSSRRTSRILAPFLKWLFPEIRIETLDAVQWVVRKLGHCTEFGILAVLFWLALRGSLWRRIDPWDQRSVGIGWLLAVAYAASDEWHQSFVATRQGQPMDVIIDAFGATVAMVLLSWIAHRRWRPFGNPR